ncbi:conjugal transfer protein TraD [Rhodospirillaceae bacterium KN72]|uniref:Conjugal transfer protein TraD n=1 Tax=Pacificispira spongiicola TaxID=2729598 RepID=A0A7Y0DYG8_9PROT|nr:conjugal transfer protein TraD [Pacificispira spongiicola]NMM43916.1 conjugal transfer protein TraD [Pacificispira spongiicola]
MTTDPKDEIATIERLTLKGVPVSVDPEAAGAMGAFEEDALDEETARESGGLSDGD